MRRMMQANPEMAEKMMGKMGVMAQIIVWILIYKQPNNSLEK